MISEGCLHTGGRQAYRSVKAVGGTSEWRETGTRGYLFEHLGQSLPA